MRGDTVIASFARVRFRRTQALGAQPDRGEDRRAILSPRAEREGTAAAVDQLRPGRRHHRDHEAPGRRGDQRGGSGRYPGQGRRHPAGGRHRLGGGTGRHDPREGPGPMSHEWIAALGDRDPSVAIALAAITRAAGPSDTVSFADLVMSYREAHLACYQAIGNAKEQEISGDEIRDHLGRSVLPRLAAEGWILDTFGHRLGAGPAPGALVGSAPEDRQAIYDELLGAARRAVQRTKPLDAAADVDQRARGRRPGQELQGSPGGRQGDRPGGAGRDRRSPRPERGGKDHDLLPYYGLIRPDAGRVRLDGLDLTRAPDVRAGPRGHRLSGPGALDLPEDDGRGEHSGHPRDPRSRARGAAQPARAHAR